MTDDEYSELIEKCAKAAEAEISRAHEEGETDLGRVQKRVASSIRDLKLVPKRYRGT